MQNCIIKLFTLAVVCAVFMFAWAITAQANMGGFSVTPIFPDNQDPAARGYFDLRVVAGQRQEIAVEVGNDRESSIDVTVSLITAGTNLSGYVDYSSNTLQDETMLHPFGDIASMAGDATVTVPPGESRVIPIYIDIPAEGFDGIILGSVHALLELTEEELEAGGMIVNRFAHVIVVRLQERDETIGTNFLLDEVEARLINYRTSIVANVRNPQPRLTMGALASARIYLAGSNTPVFVRENVHVDFAPNSVFPFIMMDEAGYGLQAGDYIAQIEVTHDGISWHFEHEFTIEPQEAASLNAAAVNVQQQAPTLLGGGVSTNVIIAVAAGALLVVLGALMMILKSRRNTQKDIKALQMQLQQQLQQQVQSPKTAESTGFEDTTENSRE